MSSHHYHYSVRRVLLIYSECGDLMMCVFFSFFSRMKANDTSILCFLKVDVKGRICKRVGCNVTNSFNGSRITEGANVLPFTFSSLTLHYVFNCPRAEGF